MREPERPIEHIRERPDGFVRVRRPERRFGELDVEVRELAPHEPFEGREIFTEEVPLDEAGALRDRGLGARQDPARVLTLGVGPLVRRTSGERLGVLLDLGEDEAPDIPELVPEVPRVQKLRLGELAVRAGGDTGDQREAERIGAIFLDETLGAHDVPERLAHLHVAHAHETVEVDRVEGNLPHVLEAHHDHARDPEEDDVVARLHDRARVVLPQVGRLVGPAERAVRPERRREPGVEHVGVLIDVVGLTARTARGIRRVLLGHDDVVAVSAVPDRDGVSPPDLPRDRPVADVLHPIEVDLLLVTGIDRDVALAHGLDRGRRERLHAHPPLLHHERLVDRPAAIVHTDGVRDRLLLREKALPTQQLHHLAARGVAVRTGERTRRGRHHPALVDDREHLQPVALPDLEVGRVVAGRDLERARPELAVDGLIGDDPDAPFHRGHEDLLADVGLPALVVWMHRHGDVRDDRLGACRRDHHVGRPRRHRVGPGIADVVERVGPLDVLGLEVRIRRLVAHAPVHDPVVAVKMPMLVEPDEVGAHGSLLCGVHREVWARPVQGTAEHAELPIDPRPVVVHPPPHLREELLAAQLLAGDPLLRELVLHDDLGDDPGVVRARHIERRLTTHPVVASHEVLVPAKAEGVAQVQIAGDVRKRQHHHERLLRVFVGREEARALPPLVEIGFDGGRPEVLLREIERRLRRSFVSRHQLLTPSRKQKRRLVQGRAASWYHPGFAQRSRAVPHRSALTGGPVPARGRPSEPLTAARLHQSRAFSIGARLVLLPVAAGCRHCTVGPPAER